MSASHSLTTVVMVFVFLICSLVPVNAQLPLINWTHPPDNTTYARPDDSVWVNFDTSMDTTTINESTFYVYGNMSGFYSGAFSFTFEGYTHTAIFDTDTDFKRGENISVLLTMDIQSEFGIPLFLPHAWSFYVGGGVGPGTFPLAGQYAGDTASLPLVPWRVLAVDLDGDEDLDMVVQNVEFELDLYFNPGDARFGDPVVLECPTVLMCLSSADVDADGDVDLLVGGDGVMVYKNDGAGGFADTVRYSGEVGVWQIVPIDCNSDAAIDLVGINGTSLYVWFNDGSGGYSVRQDYVLTDPAASITAGDFDGDRFVDLCIQHENTSDSISIWLNYGTGVFARDSAYDTWIAPLEVVAGNVDADSDLDVFVIGPGGVAALVNNGDGTFTPTLTGDTAMLSAGTIGDIDGDGDLDGIGAGWYRVDGTDPQPFTSVFIYENDGTGNFSEPVLYLADDTTVAVWKGIAAGDLNGDGAIDIMTANTSSRTASVLLNAAPPAIDSTIPFQNTTFATTNTHIEVYFNTAMDESTLTDASFVVTGSLSGTRSGSLIYDPGSQSVTFTPDADFDHGEVVTVSLTTEIESSIGIPLQTPYAWGFTVWAGVGPGTFPLAGQYAGDTASLPLAPWHILAADLDGDADLDMVVQNVEFELDVYFNPGDADFGAPVPFSIEDFVGMYCLSSADVDADGDVDLLVGGDGVLVYKNDGAGDISDTVRYSGEIHVEQIVPGDYNGDGAVDVIGVNGASLYVWFNDGSGGYFVRQDYVLTDPVASITVGDFDGDGILDLCLHYLDLSFNISIWTNNGKGVFTEDSIYYMWINPLEVRAGNADNDSDLDVFVIGPGGIAALVNNGDGTFTPTLTADTAVLTGGTIGDVDGDGDLDGIGVGWYRVDGTDPQPFTSVFIYENDGTGNFSEPVIYLADDTVNAVWKGIAAGDLNGDGAIDIMTANINSRTASVLLNAIPPEVVSTAPSENAPGAAIDSDISIEFNTDMVETSVDNSTMFVTGGLSGIHSGLYSYNSGTRTFSFDPDIDFDHGELVTVVLTTEIESVQGVPLQSSRTWSFTSAADYGLGQFARDFNFIGDTGGMYPDEPRDICAADFDGDGDLDMAVVNQVFHLWIFLNPGNGEFGDPVELYYEVDMNSVAAGDCDSDGDIDLIVGDDDFFNGKGVSIYSNNGDGSFGAPTRFVFGYEPQDLFVTDINGDGAVDVLALGTYEFYILMNDGSGSFTSVNTFALGGQAISFCTGDFNGDATIDMSVVFLGDSAGVYFNDGDGIFTGDTVYHCWVNPIEIESADIDNDADLDIIVMGTGGIDPLFNNGDGSFANPYVMVDTCELRGGVVADVDGDGDLDAVGVGHYFTGGVEPQPFTSFFVYANDGAGGFAGPNLYLAEDSANAIWRTIRTGDFNGDGAIDIMTSSMQHNSVSTHLNAIPPAMAVASPIQHETHATVTTDISASFTAKIDESSCADSTIMVYGSITGPHDGVISSAKSSYDIVFNPNDDFVPGEIVNAVFSTDITSIHGIGLIAPACWSFTAAVDGGTGTYTNQDSLDVAADPIFVLAADLNGDDWPDIVSANRNSNSISVLLNNGDATFDTPAVDYAVDPQPHGAIAVDVDEDDDLDIVTANRYLGTISVLHNLGDGTFGEDSVYAAGPGSTALAAGDLDGDHDLDIVTANADSYNVSVLLNDGTGSFSLAAQYATNTASSVAISDLDNDYDLDLAVSNWTGPPTLSTVSVLLNNGDGTFSPKTDFPVGIGAFWVMSADLDGDSYADLVSTAHYDSSISVMINQGDATFASYVSYPTGVGPYGVAPADVDGDGDLDLLATSYYDYFITLFRNDGTGTFEVDGTYSTLENPVTVATADFDQDGDIDAVVNNSSRNKVTVMLNKDAYICGDAGGDETVNVGDAVYLVNYIFKGGPAPDPLESGDVNCDSNLNVGDAVYLINYIFKGGELPCDPDGDGQPDC